MSRTLFWLLHANRFVSYRVEWKHVLWCFRYMTALHILSLNLNFDSQHKKWLSIIFRAWICIPSYYNFLTIFKYIYMNIFINTLYCILFQEESWLQLSQLKNNRMEKNIDTLSHHTLLVNNVCFDNTSKRENCNISFEMNVMCYLQSALYLCHINVKMVNDVIKQK
jgi:hypothetical protein